MKEMNKDKSVNGNEFQRNVFTKSVKAYKGRIFSRNGHTYKVGEIGKKISDIELELKSHPDIRIIMECTTSIRDDRYWAKEIQAKLIKEALKAKNKGCIYALVVPDDVHYGTNKAEINNNKRFEHLINDEIAKKQKIGFIDLMIRESDVTTFLAHIDTSRSKIPTRIIQNYKKKYL